MNGVEILATETIYATILPGWCTVIGVILLFFSLGWLVTNTLNLNLTRSVISAIFLICSLIFIFITQINSRTDIDYIKHKVTITDEVSMTEFYEKYEILDQEGKIYTVREREN